MKIIAILFLTIFVSSCAQKSQKNDFNKSEIPTEYQDLLTKVDTLRTDMIDYMKEANPDYTEKDVNQCVMILHAYIQEIIKCDSKRDGLNVVKSKIQELNLLNDKCNGQLIETDEREQIADIFILAGSRKGYNGVDEDITEEWREW